MERRGLIVAIDGPAGAGKSTAARALARRLGYRYVDTGAMYRAVALAAIERGLDLDDAGAVAEVAGAVAIGFETDVDGEQRVLLDGRDVTAAIRTEAVGQGASKVSAHAGVRERLVALQREVGGTGGAVLEGRDIGTVVFPGADVKFFLEASPTARAERRRRELEARGASASLADVIGEMEERDRRDSTRAHSPLRCADDAERVDTSFQGVDQVVADLESRVRRVLRERA
ncbi:MAG: CMP/dCMP kinase [Candidatus Binatota bacterium]|jgi:cytidylate kinase|nr:CMP/dCMP kinase [Candidatus Binatota bacterium]